MEKNKGSVTFMRLRGYGGYYRHPSLHSVLTPVCNGKIGAIGVKTSLSRRWMVLKGSRPWIIGSYYNGLGSRV